MTIKTLHSYFGRLQKANPERLASFHWGDWWKAWSERTLVYPNITVYSLNKSFDGKLDTVEVTITISDMIRDDEKNLLDVEHSTHLLCRNVFDNLRRNGAFASADKQSTSLRFFKNAGGDYVAGHTFTVRLTGVGKWDCDDKMKVADCFDVGRFDYSLDFELG